MSNTTYIQKQARQKVAELTTLQLVEAFEATDAITDKSLNELTPAVRGWLLDELERRDYEAFKKWMISAEAGPRAFYIVESLKLYVPDPETVTDFTAMLLGQGVQAAIEVHGKIRNGQEAFLQAQSHNDLELAKVKLGVVKGNWRFVDAGYDPMGHPFARIMIVEEEK